MCIRDRGYTQVLWLDGVEQKYVEEVGAMNMMFVIDGKIVTPMLNLSLIHIFRSHPHGRDA